MIASWALIDMLEIAVAKVHLSGWNDWLVIALWALIDMLEIPVAKVSSTTGENRLDYQEKRD